MGNNLTLSNLETKFIWASEYGRKYIAVEVQMGECSPTEVVINPLDNILCKLEYYKSAYNEDLTLKNAPDKIKIIGVYIGDSYEEIERQYLKKK